ncbi:hypothetical protein [Prosthecobacter sp.]|uniref:RNA polymerase sigma factor n=1 Tax=Prosthecobacter sp. TaxID=1965333 RepID=UPI002ABA9FA6|nr:hypothetical protein [Prosthecobacter sp.]MDZ4401916.1 hypothetical protein [Prosthecobacter sp.]
MVAQARGSRERQTAMRALGDFYTAYWYPLYAFARRKGWREEDARDQTQIFFQRLMENDLLDNADPARGRLRTFLLLSFQSQLSHAAEAAAAQKRGGGREILSLELETAEGRYQVDAIDSAATPEMVFDQAWARMMIQAAVDRVGEGAAATEFSVLRPFLTGGSPKDLSYADAAQALNITEDNTRQKISRLARRLPQALRDVVRESLTDPADELVNQEITSLRAALRNQA